jgi:hypothetical protein
MTALKIVTEILRWGYVALVTLYAGLALAVILNVLRQFAWRLWTRRASRRARSPKAGAFLAGSERFFLRDITALFLLLWLPLAALALLPTPASMNWWVLPMIISGVTYLSGWRAANYGVIVGSVGVAVGLGLFAALDPVVSWWNAAPLFLLLNGLGNLSGWLGAFIGRGQIREAQCLTHIKLRLSGQGAALYRVIEEIDPVVSDLFHQYWPVVEQVEGSGESLMLAECANLDGRAGAIVALEEQVRWVHNHQRDHHPHFLRLALRHLLHYPHPPPRRGRSNGRILSGRQVVLGDPRHRVRRRSGGRLCRRAARRPARAATGPPLTRSPGAGRPVPHLSGMAAPAPG